MKLNISHTLSVLTVAAVLLSMVFSDSPLPYIATIVFLFVLVALLYDLVEANPSGYPWFVLLVYGSFFIYVMVYSTYLLLFSDGFTARYVLTSLYLISLLLVCFLLFK